MSSPPPADHSTAARPSADERLQRAVATILVTVAIAAWALALVESIDLLLSAQGVEIPAAALGWLLPVMAGPTSLVAMALAVVELAVALLALRGRERSASGDRGARPRPYALYSGISAFASTMLLSSWVKEYVFELHYTTHAYDRAASVALVFSVLNTLLTAVLLVVAAAIGWQCHRWLRATRERSPERARRFFLALAVAAAAAGAAGGYLLITRQSNILPALPRAVGTVGVLLLLQGAVVALLPSWRPTRRVLVPALVASIGAGGLLVVMPMPLLHVPRQLLVERSSVAGSLMGPLEWLADFDGDGAPALLGGPDCDDSDPSIHPLALDVPDDGIDQNCSGADATAWQAAPWRSAETARPAAPPAKSVVWIVVDSLRADRTAAGGAPRTLTQHIDAFSERAACFSAARAQASHTKDSFPSFLTSRYPSIVKRLEQGGRLSPTLASVLRAQGYETAIVTPVRDLPGQAMAGFRIRETSIGGRADFVYGVTSTKVSEAGASLLKRLAGQRFFLLLHYFDPHGAYIPHEAFYFGDSDEARYDSEVAYTDMAVGAVLDLLEANGFLEDTIVVVSADHGEAFGEHGRIAHGPSLYEEVVRVPLALWLPGTPARTVPEPVGLIDVVPTILDLLGVEPPPGIQGRSLLERLRHGGPPVDRPVYFDSGWQGQTELRGVIDGRHKYLLDLGRNVELLYDLAADPGEEHNRVGDDPQLAARLRTELGGFRDQQLHAPLFGGLATRPIPQIEPR